MGTVILQQLSGRFLAIRDLLLHLPLFWDALSALPLMWPSLGVTLAMPDLDLLEFTVLVMPQRLLLEFMVLVMPQPPLLPQPLLLPQLPTELSTTPRRRCPPCPSSICRPRCPLHHRNPGSWSDHRSPARPNCHQAGAPWTDQLCVRICHQDPQASYPPSSHRCPNCPQGIPHCQRPHCQDPD